MYALAKSKYLYEFLKELKATYKKGKLKKVFKHIKTSYQIPKRAFSFWWWHYNVLRASLSSLSAYPIRSVPQGTESN